MNTKQVDSGITSGNKHHSKDRKGHVRKGREASCLGHSGCFSHYLKQVAFQSYQYNCWQHVHTCIYCKHYHSQVRTALRYSDINSTAFVVYTYIKYIHLLLEINYRIYLKTEPVLRLLLI